MDKFQNKYRIPSARAPFWDYGWNASYFVTICTHNHIFYFGDTGEEEMVLSDVGEIALQCWLEIPEHFPFVKLDTFVIMPNHVHGIVIIDKNDDGRDGENRGIAETQCRIVETQNFASLLCCNPNIY